MRTRESLSPDGIYRNPNQMGNFSVWMRRVLKPIPLRALEMASIKGGGPPTTDEFAKEIGADFRGKDAYEGVEQAKRFVS